MPGSGCLGLPIHPPSWAKSRPAQLHTLEDLAAEACGHELACERCPGFRPSPALSTPLHCPACAISGLSHFLELRAEHKGWLYMGLKRSDKAGPRWCMQPPDPKLKLHSWFILALLRGCDN